MNESQVLPPAHNTTLHRIELIKFCYIPLTSPKFQSNDEEFECSSVNPNNLYNLNITRQRHEKQNKNKVRSGNANVINNKVNKIK